MPGFRTPLYHPQSPRLVSHCTACEESHRQAFWSPWQKGKEKEGMTQSESVVAPGRPSHLLPPGAACQGRGTLPSHCPRGQPAVGELSQCFFTDKLGQLLSCADSLCDLWQTFPLWASVDKEGGLWVPPRHSVTNWGPDRLHVFGASEVPSQNTRGLLRGLWQYWGVRQS